MIQYKIKFVGSKYRSMSKHNCFEAITTYYTFVKFENRVYVLSKKRKGYNFMRTYVIRA